MDVVSQEPAEGIMKLGSHGMYRVACDCGCAGHDIVIDVEPDEDMVTVEIWATVKSEWWREKFYVGGDDSESLRYIKRCANSVYNRLSLAYYALVKGYVETETSIILREQQAVNFAEVLLKASRAHHETPEPSTDDRQSSENTAA